MPATAAMMVPLLLVFNREEGSWKSVVEPIALTEKRFELTPAPVEEAMTKRSGLMALLDACIANCAAGVVVPTPTRPALSTMKLVAVEEPITKEGAFPSVLVGLTERRPYGEVLPTPTFPEPKTVNLFVHEPLYPKTENAALVLVRVSTTISAEPV